MTTMQQMLLGAAGGVIITIGNHTITGTGYEEINEFPPPATIRYSAYGTYKLNAAGTSGYTQGEDLGGSTSANYSGEWLGAGGTASNYSAEVVVTGSGTMSGDTTGAGVWNNLGTNRSWTSTTAYLSCPQTQTLTVTIRRDSDSQVMDTAVITIEKVAV